MKLLLITQVVDLLQGSLVIIMIGLLIQLRFVRKKDLTVVVLGLLLQICATYILY